ncbi:ATP-grasp domain-containing protein [Kribbella sp. NPDC051718]|uniref:ATP-grasp domain-containing protein n=1 Tax=Kribbella sp. NPDC051718 TaxID=3155168 RepID=UPI003447D3E7
MTVGLVYDLGSLSPTRQVELARSNGAEPVFIGAATDHVDEMAPYLQHLAEYVEAGPTVEETVERLVNRRLDAVLTFSEHQLRFTAELARALGLSGYSPETLDAVTLKDAQRRRMAAGGIPQPAFCLVSTSDTRPPELKSLAFPVIVKPVRGAGSRNTARAGTRDELTQLIDRFLPDEGALIVEEFLEGRSEVEPWGDYCAIDVLVHRGQVHPLFVSAKFSLSTPFRERGAYGPATPDVLPEYHDVLRLAEATVHALAIDEAVVDMEIKLTPTGPRLIELNGRLGAWVDDLARTAGVCAPGDLAFKVALGLPITPPVYPTTVESLAYQYIVVAPQDRSRVLRVDAPTRLRQLACVDRVTVLKQTGDDVGWELGAGSFLAEVQGRAPSRQVLRNLVHEFELLDWIALD